VTYEEYQRQRTWLLEVLRDAEERGDYHLEMDVKEQLTELEARYNEETA
jgi:hypothetical protein